MFHLMKEEKVMETKTAQHQRRMTTMDRVLSKFRHEQEKKKEHIPSGNDGGRPPQHKQSIHRRPRRRLDA
jgi:hypothetical protein